MIKFKFFVIKKMEGKSSCKRSKCKDANDDRKINISPNRSYYHDKVKKV